MQGSVMVFKTAHYHYFYFFPHYHYHYHYFFYFLSLPLPLPLLQNLKVIHYFFITFPVFFNSSIRQLLNTSRWPHLLYFKRLVEAVDEVREQEVDRASDIPIETEKPINSSNRYIRYSELSTRQNDSVESMLEEFDAVVKDCNPSTDPLVFWKKHEKSFPSLAVLARKYLSVQASSAACERLFSLSGHIFSCKRRKLNIRNFLNLVFLKLNEKYL